MLISLKTMILLMAIKMRLKMKNRSQIYDINRHSLRERRQLGFVTLNDNLAVNLKPTHPPLLNGKGQFTFLKTKSTFLRN